jgi:hypothetical protein
MSIQQRLQKVEEKLNINSEPITIELLDFSGGPLPPDKLENGILIKYVAYESNIRGKRYDYKKQRNTTGYAK